ncbi:MAG: hypothetical protein ACXACW_11285 [Candidatus Hodarchaeales archaeon]|jgi:hypothetical protein
MSRLKKGDYGDLFESCVQHLIIMPWLIFYGVKTLFIPMPTTFGNYIAFVGLYLVIRNLRLGN